MLEIGKKLRIARIKDEKADVKNLVKQQLSNSKNKWFLILDNVDDKSLWAKHPNVSQQTFSLMNYISRTANSSILVITHS